MKPWQSYLSGMVEMEREHVAENYRAGSALNEADESNNSRTRREFEEMRRRLPLLLAAEEMLEALREAKSELIDLYAAAYPGDESDNDTTKVIDKVIKVVAKASAWEDK